MITYLCCVQTSWFQCVLNFSRMTSDVDFYHLLDYLRIGAGHCQVNPRPKERVWSNCAPTPARYLWILRFNFFIVFTCRPAPQLSNLFLRAEQRFVPAVPASLALPSLLGPSSFEVVIHPEKNNGLDYDLFSCIKDFRSRGRKSGLLTKHGIADKSLAWRLALRDADDFRSRLVISQNAQE